MKKQFFFSIALLSSAGMYADEVAPSDIQLDAEQITEKQAKSILSEEDTLPQEVTKEALEDTEQPGIEAPKTYTADEMLEMVKKHQEISNTPSSEENEKILKDLEDQIIEARDSVNNGTILHVIASRIPQTDFDSLYDLARMNHDVNSKTLIKRGIWGEFTNKKDNNGKTPEDLVLGGLEACNKNSGKFNKKQCVQCAAFLTVSNYHEECERLDTNPFCCK